MQKANQSFHYTAKDGVDHFIEKGAVVGDKDEAVKGRESLFDQLVDLDKPDNKK